MEDKKDAEIYKMLTVVICSLVDHPDRVRIQGLPSDAGLVFRVLTDPSDLGKVIGKSGRIARALRVLLSANAVKLNRSYRLDIDDGTANWGRRDPGTIVDPDTV